MYICVKLNLNVSDLRSELSCLCFKHNQATIADFIQLDQEQNKVSADGLLEQLLLYLQPKLSKENWKKNGCFKHVLYFALSSAKVS